jgi:hypothetical protein
MEEAQIRATLLRLSTARGEGYRRIRRAALLGDDQAAPHFDAIDKWARDRGEERDLPAQMVRRGLRPGVMTGRVEDHMPPDPIYVMPTAVLEGE